ncbi:DoxX family protein [Plastoroseomonas arctica]|uniref:DoxX family protein n=1 Tax=Plastoroseomonas arctica TaxID=1509237 RepID=A0AAF1K765_9PROT|nr:DoxX family protein [Plastoroseomonas arctica]MBR0656931.1 DoxX family protein [Plastoroseomonas arctica]
MVLAGRVITALVVAFMLFNSIIKLLVLGPVVESFTELGLPLHLAVPIGVIELVATLLYAVPRTAPLGAVLLTAVMGGAIATHLRLGSPLLSHTLFGVWLGALMWLGVWLRDPALRALLPWRRG